MATKKPAPRKPAAARKPVARTKAKAAPARKPAARTRTTKPRVQVGPEPVTPVVEKQPAVAVVPPHTVRAANGPARCPACTRYVTSDDAIEADDNGTRVFYHAACYRQGFLDAGMADPFADCCYCEKIITGEVFEHPERKVHRGGKWVLATFHEWCYPGQTLEQERAVAQARGVTHPDDAEDRQIAMPLTEPVATEHEVKVARSGRRKLGLGEPCGGCGKTILRNVVEAPSADPSQPSTYWHGRCLERGVRRAAAAGSNDKVMAPRRTAHGACEETCVECNEPITRMRDLEKVTAETEAEADEPWHKGCYQRVMIAAGQPDPYAKKPRADKEPVLDCKLCSPIQWIPRSQFVAHIELHKNEDRGQGYHG